MRVPANNSTNAGRVNDPDALSTIPVSPQVSSGSDELLRRSKTCTTKKKSKRTSKLLAPKASLADELLQKGKPVSLRTLHKEATTSEHATNGGGAVGYMKTALNTEHEHQPEQLEAQSEEHNRDSLKSRPSPQFLQQKAFILLPSKVDLSKENELEVFQDDEDPCRLQKAQVHPIISEKEAKKLPPSSYLPVDEMAESSGRSKGGGRRKTKKKKKLKKEKSISSLSTNQWALSADDWSQWGDEANKDSEKEAWRTVSKGPPTAAENHDGVNPVVYSNKVEGENSACYLPGPTFGELSASGGRASVVSEVYQSSFIDDDSMTFLSFDEMQSFQSVVDTLDQSASKSVDQHELLVDYIMMTKGMDRSTAEKATHAFMAEQPAFKVLSNSQHASEGDRSTSSSSRSSLAYLERRYSREGEQPSTFTETTRHSSQSSALAPIVEANHNVGIESYDPENPGMPHSLSKSTISADVWKQSDRSGRTSIRCWIILACLIIVAVASAIGISLIFLLQGNGSSVMLTEAPSMAPTFVLEELLEAALRLSGEENSFEPDSPQFQAVGWMSSVDMVNTGGYGSVFAQRYAMVTLYFSLGGGQWANPQQWLDPTKHECDWGASVTCGFDIARVRVTTGIDMTNNRLFGTLPTEIGLLSSLARLRLSTNKLSSSIPSTVASLRMLAELDLSFNELTGPIPPSIGADVDLTDIDLSFNHLDGTLPSSLYDLPLLRTLVLTRNNFSGQLDSAMQSMQSLVQIDVRNNTFTGPFPFDDFEQTKNIDIFRCDYNEFSGTFPKLKGSVTSVHQITVSHNNFQGQLEVDTSFLFSLDIDEIEFLLYYVDMSYNNFTGPVSPLLGFLPSLRHVDFSGNSFSGNFPSALSWAEIEFLAASNNNFVGTLPKGLPTLTHLDMSFNNFSASIPEDICKYSQLEALILTENQLSNTIPACMQRLWKLRHMELSDNQLLGTIPTVLGFLEELETLNLSNNTFDGTIPSELGNLVAMKNLWLSENSLTSTIPPELGRLTQLQTLNLEDNLLTGIFPPELGALQLLKGIHVGGNRNIDGEIPAALCEVDTLNLSVKDVGCDVKCSCCGDTGGACRK